MAPKVNTERTGSTSSSSSKKSIPQILQIPRVRDGICCIGVKTRSDTKNYINKNDQQNDTTKLMLKIVLDYEHKHNKPLTGGAARLENGWVIKTGWWYKNSNFTYVHAGDRVQ